MAKKTVEINGINFDVKGTTQVKFYTAKSLFECYERPSHIKELIWYRWYNTLLDMGFTSISIRSYNSNVFTIKAYNDTMYVEIFPTHNDLYYIV